MKRELVTLLVLCSCCNAAVGGLCLFILVSWVGLWSVSVTFAGHTHLLLEVRY